MAKQLPDATEVHTVSLSDVRPLNEANLRKLFSWVDEIPLSRPKKFINRDFSDGGKITAVIIKITKALLS